ncbi:hypothetical protein THAOC_23410, partial [Thalassiosira oceanica]
YVHALLDIFESLAAPPRFGSTPKNSTTPSVRNGKGRRPICLDARLRLRVARLSSSPQHLGMGVESQSTALGTDVTTPHDVFWPRTKSSRLNKPPACRVRPRLRYVAIQNAGIRASRRDSHIDSPSKLRRITQSRRDVKRRLSASTSPGRAPLYGRRPRDAAQFPASGTPSGLSSYPIASGNRTKGAPPSTVYCRVRPSSTHGYRSHIAPTAGGFTVIRHRAPLTPEIEIARFQSEVRHTGPNQAERPPSPGIRHSPWPVRRPSADPVLAQPMSFTSSDVAVFLSARRDEASANDTPGSQIAQLVTPKITVTCLRLMTILVLKKWGRLIFNRGHSPVRDTLPRTSVRLGPCPSQRRLRVRPGLRGDFSQARGPQARAPAGHLGYLRSYKHATYKRQARAADASTTTRETHKWQRNNGSGGEGVSNSGVSICGGSSGSDSIGSVEGVSDSGGSTPIGSAEGVSDSGGSISNGSGGLIWGGLIYGGSSAAAGTSRTAAPRLLGARSAAARSAVARSAASRATRTAASLERRRLSNGWRLDLRRLDVRGGPFERGRCSSRPAAVWDIPAVADQAAADQDDKSQDDVVHRSHSRDARLCLREAAVRVALDAADPVTTDRTATDRAPNNRDAAAQNVPAADEATVYQATDQSAATA